MPTSKDLVGRATLKCYELARRIQRLHRAIMRLEDSLMYDEWDYREAWDETHKTLEGIEETVRRIRQDIDGIEGEEGNQDG